MVVHPHGGPNVRDTIDTIHMFSFSKPRYAVFQPNFRGSTGYGHITIYQLISNSENDAR